jgi:uncharacterized membrane protein
MNSPVNISMLLILVCIFSGALRLLYFIVLQTGYRKGDLSVVYPLARGSAPLFATIGAIAFIHEQPTPNTMTGLILIVVGVIVLTKPGIVRHDAKLKAGIVFGLLTGVIIAIYTLWDKLAISHFSLSPLTITFSSHLLGTIVLASPAIRNLSAVKREIKLHKWHIILISILSPLSYLFVLEAMKTTDVLYVAPARELSILFAVLIGGQLMDEKDLRRRLLASGLILGGVIVLVI